MLNDYKLLGIVLPTFNRPQCVKYILDNVSKYIELGYNITFDVYDSSTNNETQEIFKNLECGSIKYVRIPSEMDVDEKTLLAVKECKAENIMLIGDRYLPRIENIFNSLNLESNDNEIIALYDERWKPQKKFYKKLKTEKYENRDDFFKDHFWQIILYGGSICKKTLIDKIDIEDAVKNYNKSGFIYPSVLTQYSTHNFQSKIGTFLDVIPFGTDSGWINQKTAIKIWTKNFYDVLNNSSLKLKKETIESIISTTGKNTGFLTVKGLLHFKSSKNFTFKIYRNYKFYIKKCKACSGFSAFMIAICPSFIFVLMRKIYRLFKRK